MTRNLKERAPGIWEVHCSTGCIGVVVQGDFIERLNGEVLIIGRHWSIIGYEYARFKTRDRAVSALCGLVTIEKKRGIKLVELGHVETKLALITNKARRKTFKTTIPGVRREHRKTRKELVKINQQCVQSSLCMEGPLARKPRKSKEVIDE